jgi:hypothetical protein
MAEIDDMTLVAKLFGPRASEVRDGLAPEVNTLLDEVAADVLASYVSGQSLSDLIGAIRSLDEAVAAECGRELATECRAVLRVRLDYIETERRRLDMHIENITAEVARLEAIRAELSGGGAS